MASYQTSAGEAQEISKQEQQSPDDFEETHQAPLIKRTGMQPPPGMKGGYIVALFPEYSFEQHCANVGRGLKAHAKGPLSGQKQPVYVLIDVDEELISWVRLEPGVEWVRESQISPGFYHNEERPR